MAAVEWDGEYAEREKENDRGDWLPRPSERSE